MKPATAAIPVLLVLLALGLAADMWLRSAELRSAQQQVDLGARAAAAALGSRMGELEARLKLFGALDGPDDTGDRGAKALLASDAALLECLRVDAAGRVRSRAARGSPILAEQFSRPQANWFREAAAGRPYLGLWRDAAGAPAAWVLALPAPGGGAIAARLKAESLDQTLRAFQPPGGQAHLVDGDGRLLASSSALPRTERGLIQEEEAPAARGRLLAEASFRPLSGRPSSVLAAPMDAWKVVVDAPRSALGAGSGTLESLLLLGLVALAVALASAAARARASQSQAGAGPDEEPAAAFDSRSGGAAPDGPIGSAEMDAVLARLDAMVARAKEVDRLKSEFLATISHELRTPLNSVIGYAELILSGVNGPVDAETQKDLRAIHENGQQLLRIVNDLLDLAKIEAHRIELELVQLDAAGLLAQAVETWRTRAEKKGLLLSWEAPPDLPQVWGDVLRLQQVLSNLISNAIKFTEAGGIRLEARAAGAELAISVSDSGVGIAPEDQETIFERFRQLDGSFTRRAGGTGLGLAISRHLVRMHGGRLEVESLPGRGTTFTLYLPVELRPSHAHGRPVGPLLW